MDQKTKVSIFLYIGLLILLLGFSKLFLNNQPHKSQSVKIEHRGNNIKIAFPITGDNGDDNSVNIIPVPIILSPSLSPKEFLAKATLNCYFVTTYEAVLGKRVEYNADDTRFNTLEKIESGKSYKVRCRGNQQGYLQIEGLPLKSPFLQDANSPQWIAIRPEDDNKKASQVLREYSQNQLQCQSISPLNKPDLIYLDQNPNTDFLLSSSEGYRILCQIQKCPQTSVCQVDFDNSGKVTDLDIYRISFCIDEKNKTSDPELWEKLVCGSNIYDTNQDQIMDKLDVSCAESKILLTCQPD